MYYEQSLTNRSHLFNELNVALIQQMTFNVIILILTILYIYAYRLKYELRHTGWHI